MSRKRLSETSMWGSNLFFLSSLIHLYLAGLAPYIHPCGALKSVFEAHRRVLRIEQRCLLSQQERRLCRAQADEVSCEVAVHLGRETSFPFPSRGSLFHTSLLVAMNHVILSKLTSNRCTALSKEIYLS